MGPEGNNRVAMMVWNTCENDSRVIKEATTLASAGYEVTVVCLAAPHLPEREVRDGVTYVRVEEALGSLRRNGSALARAMRRSRRRAKASSGGGTYAPSPSRWLASLYRVLTLPLAYVTMKREVVRARPAIVHAHDLQTLPAASRITRKLNAALVYDSHELAAHVSIRFPATMRSLIERIEKRHIRRADAVITVSPGIANHLSDRYGIPKPDVVLNSPPTPATSSERTVRSDLGLEDDVLLALYVGGLAAHRGLEETVDAVALLPNVHLACVGPRRPEWEDAMLERAKRLGADERVHFLDPVHFSELTSYLSTADVGVVAIQDVCLSYRYALPNKLFETVLSGVPVVVGALPQMKEFVQTHQVGVVVDERQPHSLAEGIKLTTSTDAFTINDETLADLRAAVGWDAQACELLSLYRRLRRHVMSPDEDAQPCPSTNGRASSR